MRRRDTVFALLAAPAALVGFRAWGASRWLGQDGETGKRGSAMFEWLPSECAHERWPMQLVSGVLHCSQGRNVAIPVGKIVNNGLGEIASLRVMGDPLKPVPERASLLWFSFAEDRFFGGTFELPTARLTDLFRAGFIEPRGGERTTWSRIIVGMGLGGWAHVWLSGGTFVREIAHIRLPEAEAEWRRVIDNPNLRRTDFVRSVLKARIGEAGLADLDRRGPPAEVWPRYARRYPWAIRCESPHAPLDMTLRHFNGERTYRHFASTPLPEAEAAPKYMQLTWRPATGSRLLTTIRFDEQEIYAAFDKASASAPPILVIAFPGKTRVTLAVEVNRQRIPLSQAVVEVNSLA